ncbi:hypothetical protein [Catenulispora rubra]|uniref:antitoxin VbhA family protein n=1 Tax=Catenulispora rubra TaxID=280293 RepID=UPI00189209DB|nr:hypothetical protein [Catenulispora rubra]
MTSQNDEPTADGRRAALESARASVRAEGLVPGPEFDADAEAYVAGTLSVDELVERAEQRHRKPGAAS